MDRQVRVASMRQALVERLGDPRSNARLFRAPGRVNLIGEHTDYNNGFVMPMAIGLDSWVLMSPRDDGRLAIHSLNLDETVWHRLGDPAEAAQPGGFQWSQYVIGVAESLRSSGYPISGANLVIHGNVPIGSGLSSSASLEVAVAMALISRLAGEPPTTLEIAQICQRAENEYVGARCGIMDQFVAVHGVEGHAVMLDCQSFDHSLVSMRFDSNPVSILVCNTMVRHQLASGEYNRRRQECEAAVAVIAANNPSVRSLRDVSIAMLDDSRAQLAPVLFRRARHVVTENSRVGEMASALAIGDLGSIGEAMRASHQSLRDDYSVSCEELDHMVASASDLPGVVGSRMTGGGFGGCTVNLVEKESLPMVCAEIQKRYQVKTGLTPEFYVCDAAPGAGELHVE
jgi:galactokinase